MLTGRWAYNRGGGAYNRADFQLGFYRSQKRGKHSFFLIWLLQFLLDIHFILTFLLEQPFVEENGKEKGSKSEMVWSSSQLSWRSTCVPSMRTSWRHQRMKSVGHDGRVHWDWMRDRPRTTRLLYTPQHSYWTSCHCPDPWLKTPHLDDQTENHQQFLQTYLKNKIPNIRKEFWEN